MEKKTLRERLSRLKGIAQLVAKLPIRGLRLLGPIGACLMAPCALVAFLTGCALLAPTAPRDVTAAEASPTELRHPPPRHVCPQAARTPRIRARAAAIRSVTGRPRTACPSSLAPTAISIRCSRAGVVRRAPIPSPLRRAAAEPVIRYEYYGQTLTLDDYLARNPTTGLLIARGDTILLSATNMHGHHQHRFTSWSMAKTVTAMSWHRHRRGPHRRSMITLRPTYPRWREPNMGAPRSGICSRCPRA